MNASRLLLLVAVILFVILGLGSLFSDAWVVAHAQALVGLGLAAGFGSFLV